MQYMNVKGLDGKVSKIVMGSAGGTPGFSYDQQDLFDEMMDIYFEAGGNMIDTARIYGTAKASEALVANWIHKRKVRDKVFITDKCCSPYQNRHEVLDESRSRVHPELISEDLVWSLDRMEYHREQGKIRTYGVSNWSTERIQKAVAYCEKKNYQGISVNEPSYSLATVKECRWPNTVYINDDEARLFAEMGLSVFSFSPMGAGFFAGVFFRKGAVINEGIRKTYFIEENLEKYKRAELLAHEHGTDVPTIALSYIVSQNLTVAPIIGPKTPAEVRSCLNCVDLKLTDAEIEYLSLRSDTI